MVERVKLKKAEPEETKPEADRLVVKEPDFKIAKVRVQGDAPYVMNKFSSDNRRDMMEKQQRGHQAKKGAKRDPKDFDKVYRGAMHISKQGWFGIPSSSFRNALISSCKIVGFAMTRAKLSLFIVADGIDRDDGTPLVKITKGEPNRRDVAVKLANGATDILARPYFEPGWEAEPTLKWDFDQFSDADVFNLLTRAGIQCGIGAGRPDSKNSCGCGWGTFRIKDLVPMENDNDD